MEEEIKDFNVFQKELTNQYNRIRTDPKSFVDNYKQAIKWFDKKVMRIPGQKAGISTQEGDDCFYDAISALKKQKAVGKLETNPALQKVADDYLKAIQNEDPEKIDEISIDNFIEKHGSYEGSFRRALDFGTNNPILSVMNLYAGDGDSERSQREGMVDEGVNLIACACGTHKTYRNVNVILTCTKFKGN